MNTDFLCQDLMIEGVKMITPFYREDNRGYFLKSFEKDIYSEFGLDISVFEDFESYSKGGVIRGMHFQTEHPQVKLVRVIKGTVHDIVVDIRRGSATYGKYVDVMLTDENHNIFLVPAGFAHGFEVLSEEAIMSYKCVGKYLSGYDAGILWNDKELNLPWRTKDPILSERDRQQMTFGDFTKQYNGLVL